MLSKKINNPTTSPVLTRQHLTGSQNQLKLEKDFNSMEDIEMKNEPSSPQSQSHSNPPSPLPFKSLQESNNFIALPLILSGSVALPSAKGVPPSENKNFVPASDLDYLVLASILEREKSTPSKPCSSSKGLFDRLFDDHQKKNAKIMNVLLRARGSTGLSSHNSKKNKEGVKRKEKKKPKRPNKVKPQGCEWCHEKSSPVWRTGPSGRGSLCNACGLQWQKGFTIERAKETLRKPRGEWSVPKHL